MQGLFEILRLCTRVYTTIREDRIAQCKLLQYEQLLGLCEYGDVLEKTRRLNLSHIRRLPEDLEQLTKGDVAALAAELMGELEEAFDIRIDTRDVLDFPSYEQGQEVLGRYGVEI